MTDKRTAYINARLLNPESRLDALGALLTEGAQIADLGPGLFADGVPEGIETVEVLTNGEARVQFGKRSLQLQQLVRRLFGVV